MITALMVLFEEMTLLLVLFTVPIMIIGFPITRPLFCALYCQQGDAEPQVAVISSQTNGQTVLIHALALVVDLAM